MDVIKDRLSRRQTDMASVSIVQNQASVGAAQQLKHLIQTLTSACGMQEIRTTAVQKLDMWLQNIKIAKPAQVSVCVVIKLKKIFHPLLYVEFINEKSHSSKLKQKALPTC